MRPGFTPQDPDFESRVRDTLDAQTMMATAGVEIAGLGPGWIELEVPHRAEFTQQHGYMHAGLIAAVMDSACGGAAFTLMPANSQVLTVEYKINLLRPAKAERYFISGHVVKAGRTLTVCQATTRDDERREIAVMTGTLIAVSSPTPAREDGIPERGLFRPDEGR